MAEKPRVCQLPLPAKGRDNWEQLVGSQERGKHYKARLPAYWLVIYNANDRLAGGKGLGTHCIKLCSYDSSLILFQAWFGVFTIVICLLSFSSIGKKQAIILDRSL